MKKLKAIITGITGQSGSYMAELLLRKNYQVFGMKRRTSTNTLQNIEHIKNDITLIDGDLLDHVSLNKMIKDIQPDELYSYAAQSHVKTSFEQPEYTSNCNALGTLRLLDSIREFSPHTRFYNSATSELFGGETGGPYNENSLLVPKSPYGCSKLYAYHITNIYRQSYNLFACSGLTFNHESVRRSEDFLTKKLSLSAARIKLGLQDKLFLGNLDAKRDITHAKDVVIAQWLMLQCEKPDDYVIGSGVAISIKEMVDFVFKYVNLDWKDYVVIDPLLFRPVEVNHLVADASKAKQELGWSPTISWQNLLIEMVEHDLKIEGKK